MVWNLHRAPAHFLYRVTTAAIVSSFYSPHFKIARFVSSAVYLRLPATSSALTFHSNVAKHKGGSEPRKTGDLSGAAPALLTSCKSRPVFNAPPAASPCLGPARRSDAVNISRRAAARIRCQPRETTLQCGLLNVRL